MPTLKRPGSWGRRVKRLIRLMDLASLSEGSVIGFDASGDAVEVTRAGSIDRVLKETHPGLPRSGRRMRGIV